MAEYIDRDFAISFIEDNTKTNVKCLRDVVKDVFFLVVEYVTELLNIIPAADVAEVKHGVWIYSAETINTMSGYFCSACKDPIWHAPDVPQAFRYCPNCGAKMDGKENAE